MEVKETGLLELSEVLHPLLETTSKSSKKIRELFNLLQEKIINNFEII